MANENRLIDANALLKKQEDFRIIGRNAGRMKQYLAYIVKKMVDEAPTIDAVEVVRCKDCKWGATPYGDEHDGWTECTNLCGRPLMPDEGFCSYGERRANHD